MTDAAIKYLMLYPDDEPCYYDLWDTEADCWSILKEEYRDGHEGHRVVKVIIAPAETHVVIKKPDGCPGKATYYDGTDHLVEICNECKARFICQNESED